MTGDFFQLPPVTKGTMPTFAFEAKAWQSAIDHTVNLTQVFRQKDTSCVSLACSHLAACSRRARLTELLPFPLSPIAFIDMLNEMRFGQLTADSISKFKGLSRELTYNGVEPTEL